MECNFCKDNVKGFDKPRIAHLIIQKDNEDHVHVHGDLDKKEHIKDMLEVAEEECDVKMSKAGVLDRKEIVFHNRQRIGDALMFTCAIRDFKKSFPDVRVNVNSIAMHIWDHNPYLDRSLIATPENTVKIGPKDLTNASNRKDWHFANAYRVSMEKELNIHIEQGESRPDIWLTEEEYNAPRLIEKPYWIICVTGEKGWGCKMYPAEKWQKFVEQNPDKIFVQIGAREDNPPRLKGENIIDLVGQTQDKQTGIRDLYKLFLNAEGSIGLVSFHMHLAGALYKPAIVVAGAREPVSFTRYPGHAYLSNDGMLPCAVKACWHCKIVACTNLVKHNGLDLDPAIEAKVFKDQDLTGEEKRHYENVTSGWVPKCADMIEPEDLTRAINGYYKGGRLKIGVASGKPDRKLFKNIVQTPIIPAPVGCLKPGSLVNCKTTVPKISGSRVGPDIETYGMSFNGGAIRRDDWEFIQKIVKLGNVQTVLEFGAGLSTLLLRDLGLKVVTYETSSTWRDRVLKIKPDCDIRLWDGKNHPDFDGENKYNYDLAFVDGPSGGHSREKAVAVAGACAPLVIVHDGYDVFESEWQLKHLVGKFNGPYRNKGRCYFWESNASAWARGGIEIGPSVAEKEIEPLAKILQRKVAKIKADGKKHIVKEVSNGEKDQKEEEKGVLGGCKPRKFVKIVSTARGWGGCARSITTIMRRLLALGHIVEFIPFRNAVTSTEMKMALRHELSDVIVTENYDTLKDACDVLLMYADDYVWEFTKPEIAEAFSNIGADRKIMMLNYRRGKVGEVEWTKGWDKYMFLCSAQERELLGVLPGIKTQVLPPCTELDQFFSIKPDYNHSLRLVRHSSQGNTKFRSESYNGFSDEIDAILKSRTDVQIALLPGPDFIQTQPRVDRVPRTPDPAVIAGFLSTGNLFWYSLPPGYMDMGPRVILEAMAAGLPILADNWGGAVDRVTPETGWLCDTKIRHVDIIGQVGASELKTKGEAARARAYSHFRPEAWMEAILE